MINNNTLKVTAQGVTFSGQGTGGRPIRVFLFPSKGTYSSILKCGDEKELTSELVPNRILYFKLKNNQEITISNDIFGRMKVL